MMRPSTLKKLIVSEFEKHKKLTPYQKRMLIGIVVGIRAGYEFAARFSEYIKKNRDEIDVFINGLDEESKKEVKTILGDIDFFKYLRTNESFENKYKLLTDAYDESIFKYHHGLKYLPQEVINSLHNRDFLDCGGYIGDSALIFEREFNPRKIYSFEPDPSNYNLFLENIKSKNLKKVIPIREGVGEKTCVLKYHTLGRQSFASESGNAEMKVVSIDDFVSERNLSVGLIKIDVEGTELDVLKGAKKSIKEFKPILLIGIYHNPEEFFGTKTYIENLIPDYKFKIKHLCDFLPLFETHLIAW
jgi:FkbM family methyltransferase